MNKDDCRGSQAETRRAVNHLWDTFQVQKRGAQGMNWLAQYFHRLAELGIVVIHPNPSAFNELATASLRHWSYR